MIDLDAPVSITKLCSLFPIFPLTSSDDPFPIVVTGKMIGEVVIIGAFLSRWSDFRPLKSAASSFPDFAIFSNSVIWICLELFCNLAAYDRVCCI